MVPAAAALLAKTAERLEPLTAGQLLVTLAVIVVACVAVVVAGLVRRSPDDH